MDWLSRMRDVIDYIEEHLDEEIENTEISRLTDCSLFHFQRVFAFITDVSLGEYIRRRRLTMAGHELQRTDIKVIDTALKYGYESPEAFSRAFKKVYGISPNTAKNPGMLMKAYPRISFNITINGGSYMNYRIVEKEPFKIYGFTTHIPTGDGQNMILIPKFWEEKFEDGSCDRLTSAAEAAGVTPPHHACNAALYNFDDTGFDYMIFVNVPGDVVLGGYETLNVPAATWAIFPTEPHSRTETTEKIQSLWKSIFPNWFTGMGYEHDNAPELEMYCQTDDGQFYSEVWIPVIKK